MREIRIVVKTKEVLKKLAVMNRKGINLTEWFLKKVLEDESLE